MTYTLLGSPHSYFTGKVRGYLRWKGVPYREILSTREVYKTEILPRVGWPVIPVVITPDGKTLQDTSEIIDAIEARESGSSIYPTGPRQRIAALLLELFGDEWMVLPAMHYRWNYNEDWVYGEFGKMQLPDASIDEQKAIGKEVGARFRGFVPMLGVSDATVPAVEARYEAFLDAFSEHLKARPYLFGTRPSIGDYGLLGPMYAHLYRDKASGEILEKLAPLVARWTERTHAPQEALSGEFDRDDFVPETLGPLLQQIFTDQVPVLKATISALKTWAEDQSADTEVPRGLGMTRFTLGDSEGERAIMSFNLWRYQRVLEAFEALDQDQQLTVRDWLGSIGGGGVFDLPAFPRMKRKNFKLALA